MSIIEPQAISMTALDIRLVPLLQDNYSFIAHDPDSGRTAVVDPAEAEPMLAELKRLGWGLDFIFNTHHHGDHVGGNLAIKQATGAAIIGPGGDAARIPGIDRGVAEGDTVTLGRHEARVFEVHGHTRGHIAYWFGGEDAALFCGDTLFALGCGRLFEGTPAQMWNSLSKLKALPPETRVYCAHEYTQSNCRFALTVEPENDDLQLRAAEIARARQAGQPTVPSTIGRENATNPFLRAERPALQAAMGASGDAVATFAEIRRRKDHF